MMFRLLLMLLWAVPASADSIIATRTIRANAMILDTDVTSSTANVPAGFTRIDDVIGQEARITLYAGRPILTDDIGPPAIITRNQIVRMEYQGTGLSIAAEGRALERGAIGDRIRLMNLSSRATIFGQVQQDGTVQVQN